MMILKRLIIMDSKIQALLDHEEIRNLRTLYAHHLDSNNIAELDQVFSPDAVVEVTVGKMEGISAIQAGLKEAYALFDRDNKSNNGFGSGLDAVSKSTK